MQRFVLSFAGLVMLIALYGQVQAAPIFFVNNPSSNSTDWATSIAGLGGSINTNVNFNTHPLGALNPNFYTVSDGVTFSTSGAITDVQSGAGPAQGNTGGAQPGEGLHAASNFLFGQAGPKTLTMSFTSPILGVGLFTLDYFDTSINDRMTLTAFDGPNGTGNALGNALSVNQNFQNNNLYFMGVSSADNNIRSIQFSYNGTSTGDNIGIDDIRFAVGDGVVSVPEPTSLALLGLGLAGLGVMRRRKTS